MVVWKASGVTGLPISLLIDFISLPSFLISSFIDLFSSKTCDSSCRILVIPISVNLSYLILEIIGVWCTFTFQLNFDEYDNDGKQWLEWPTTQ